MVSFNFDFAPRKNVRQVIKEAQEEVRKQVIKEVIKQEIEKAPPGTPVAEVVKNIDTSFEDPFTADPNPVLPAIKGANEDKDTTSLPPQGFPETNINPQLTTTPSVSNENTTTSSSDYDSQVPAAAGTKEEALEKTKENRLASELGQSTEEEVNNVYDSLTFDFAPGSDPADVIEAAQAGADLTTPPGSSADYTGFNFGEPDDYFGIPESAPPGPPGPGGGGSGSGSDPVELTPYATGGTWYAVTGYPGVPVAYFVEYTLPGGNKIYYYADRSDLDALEGIGPNKTPNVAATISYSDLKKGRFAGGSISDVVGTTEAYATRVERTLMSPTGELLLPEWANNDKEIKDLFYVAVAENWSETRFLREMSKKQSFKDRYPAYTDMLSLTGGNHEEALANYQEYETEVRMLNNRYGETADVKNLAAEAIRKGFSLEDLQTTYDIFERAEKNAGTLLAFQKVIDAQNLNFSVTDAQGIVDFFTGVAPTEIYDLYEASSITEQAAKLNLEDLSVDEALEIARNTPGQLTNQQVSAAMTEAAKTILQYREYIDLGSYGLDADQIINLSLGYREPGGMTEVELATALSRIYNTDENLQNLASGIAGSKTFQQKDRQIRSIG